MKQYLTPEQTAKLIELGLEKPSNTIVKEEPIYREGSIIDWKPIAEEGAYSIGELIEMMPKEMDCELGDLGLSIENNIYEQPNEWIVSYDGRHQTNSIELVDALYAMILQLKEEGVI